MAERRTEYWVFCHYLHELRTPLTAITGWGETILEDNEQSPKQMRQGIRIILKESRRLTTMALNGGTDGLDFYRAISEKWKTLLPEGGRLYFEVGIGQADSVLRVMRGQGFGDIQVVQDLHGIPRVVFGTLCKEI